MEPAARRPKRQEFEKRPQLNSFMAKLDQIKKENNIGNVGFGKNRWSQRPSPDYQQHRFDQPVDPGYGGHDHGPAEAPSNEFVPFNDHILNRYTMPKPKYNVMYGKSCANF